MTDKLKLSHWSPRPYACSKGTAHELAKEQVVGYQERKSKRTYSSRRAYLRCRFRGTDRVSIWELELSHEKEVGVNEDLVIRPNRERMKGCITGLLLLCAYQSFVC